MPLATIRQHIKPTLLLSYPVVLSQLGHVMVNVCDSVMVGRLGGSLPLAAVSLNINVSTVVMVLGMGLSMGITPLVAAANGEGNVRRLGELLVHGVLLSGLGGLLLSVLGLFITPLLPYFHQPPAVVTLTTPFLRVIFLSFFPLMVFQGFRQFAEGLGLTRQAMQLSILANVINALLCYMLIFGHFGAPAMGMMGAAWATLTARIIMAVLMGAYVLRAERLRPYRETITSWLHLQGTTLRHLLGLGLPIGLQMMCEVGAFSFSGIMIGWLGATAMAAHQIAINVSSVTYMAAGGVAAAATIRVGNLRGLGDALGARQAGFTAYALTFVFMAAMGLVLISCRQLIPYLYNPHQDPAVVAQAATLLLIAALFQISDGLQVVGLGALRGLQDVKVPSLVALLAYWVVALPLGYGLGFGLKLGSLGVWIGLLAGLTTVAVVLLWRFRQHSAVAPLVNEAPVVAR
ncbi:MATE family efflux transporter [Hymenobacter sp. GOD-10R]|uniref:MATE family efflux transporter n=1 Tax=Hymenobacter sp. GOD-10R TaxID=3093922 RepID=UPI002D78BC0D|nr:MATE family efflux transporter [Hymenobacter sp. GOD-10R]WRQ30212.1 MATE family efflux transporter [Hymenobacter sp. GOD-10R]